MVPRLFIKRTFQIVISTFLFTFFLINSTTAQVKYGISIAPGMGYLFSPSLNAVQQSTFGSMPNVKSTVASKGLGFNIGLGMYVQYSFNDKLAFLTDPTFNLLNSKIYLTTKFENIDLKGTGTKSSNYAKSDINTAYFSVPLLLKYTFFQKRKLYFLAGATVNIILSSKLKSEEYNTVSTYGFERITTTMISDKTITSSSIDKINPLQAAATVGFGRQFRKKLNHFSADFRYNFPLLSSTYYTSSNNLDNAYQNNLFATSGKQMAEASNASVKLNDFKLGTFNLTVRYTIRKTDRKPKIRAVDSTATPEQAVISTNATVTPAEAKEKKKKEKKGKTKVEEEATVTEQLVAPANTETAPPETKEKKKKERKEKTTKQAAPAAVEQEVAPENTETATPETKEKKKKEKKEKTAKESAPAAIQQAVEPANSEATPTETKERKKKEKKVKATQEETPAAIRQAEAPANTETTPSETKEKKKKEKKVKTTQEETPAAMQQTEVPKNTEATPSETTEKKKKEKQVKTEETNTMAKPEQAIQPDNTEVAPTELKVKKKKEKKDKSTEIEGATTPEFEVAPTIK